MQLDCSYAGGNHCHDVNLDRQTLRSGLFAVAAICAAMIGVPLFLEVTSAVEPVRLYGPVAAFGLAALVAGFEVRG